MMLIDAGPLIAIINKRDSEHARCVDATKYIRGGAFQTTWPCFAEAMFLLQVRVGHHAQADLWRWRTHGKLEIRCPVTTEIHRMASLMAKYADLPMDLGDASLMAAAEPLGQRTIFTLDGDFRIYRFADGSSVEIVPKLA